MFSPWRCKLCYRLIYLLSMIRTLHKSFIFANFHSSLYFLLFPRLIYFNSCYPVSSAFIFSPHECTNIFPTKFRFLENFPYCFVITINNSWLTFTAAVVVNPVTASFLKFSTISLMSLSASAVLWTGFHISSAYYNYSSIATVLLSPLSFSNYTLTHKRSWHWSVFSVIFFSIICQRGRLQNCLTCFLQYYS